MSGRLSSSCLQKIGNYVLEMQAHHEWVTFFLQESGWAYIHIRSLPVA